MGLLLTFLTDRSKHSTCLSCCFSVCQRCICVFALNRPARAAKMTKESGAGGNCFVRLGFVTLGFLPSLISWESNG